METDVVDKLKASGNKELERGNLDEALDYYQQAIKIEQQLSNNKLAILHSNSAQVYLQQYKYDQAILAASKSLEHDPTFTKSLLRRGIAHVGLNKNDEATNDLRAVLRMEPKNKQAINFLRKVFQFAKLNDALRKAFMGHYLRRKVVEWQPVINEFNCDPNFGKYLLRLTVISLEFLQLMKTFWKDGRICSPDSGVYALILPPWFVAKRIKVGLLQVYLTVMFSKRMMVFILQVVRPTSLSLELMNSLYGLELSSLYEFEHVYCLHNFLLNDSKPSLTPIKQFNHVSKILTNLAYFDSIPSVPMPKLNVLRVFPTRPVSTKFVKDWAKFKWPIKRLEFRSTSPDLSSFANFKGVLSHYLTDLRVCFMYSNIHNWQSSFFTALIERLTVLKGCFPNLKNFIFEAEIKLQSNSQFLLNSNFVKTYLKLLVTVIDAKKIEWCDKPKICVELFSAGETGPNVLKYTKSIEDAVKECRNEMKELTFIRFNGPSMNKLGMSSDVCAYARIEIEANGVWIDFSFHTT